MGETMCETAYFDGAGEANTDRTLALARKRAEELGVRSIVVASTRGDTGVRAAQQFAGFNLVVVTHVTGFGDPDVQELTPQNRMALESLGARVLTGTHAFGGVGRAVRRKLATYELDEIMAYTLRMFGQGVKVAVEIAAMAADAGLVRCNEEVIAIAGTGSGADTAAVIVPAHVHNIFDLRVVEIVCRPRHGLRESVGE